MQVNAILLPIRVVKGILKEEQTDVIVDGPGIVVLVDDGLLNSNPLHALKSDAVNSTSIDGHASHGNAITAMGSGQGNIL